MVVVSRAQYDDIVTHALGQPDEEICGMLGGREGRVERIYHGHNVAETRRTRFLMDPHDILAISDEIENAGLDLVGFYHSHTHTQAYPSPTDVADWPARWYPDALCVICSLMEEGRPQLRAFHIDEAGKITEEPITIGD
jgi:proteasome lid subunit RPN8/RPN11